MQARETGRPPGFWHAWRAAVDQINHDQDHEWHWAGSRAGSGMKPAGKSSHCIVLFQRSSAGSNDESRQLGQQRNCQTGSLRPSLGVLLALPWTPGPGRVKTFIAVLCWLLSYDWGSDRVGPGFCGGNRVPAHGGGGVTCASGPPSRNRRAAAKNRTIVQGSPTGRWGSGVLGAYSRAATCSGVACAMNRRWSAWWARNPLVRRCTAITAMRAVHPLVDGRR